MHTQILIKNFVVFKNVLINHKNKNKKKKINYMNKTKMKKNKLAYLIGFLISYFRCLSEIN